PYRGRWAALQVAVTPARTSATMSPRANDADAGSVGETTSATDTARTAWLFVLLASAPRTRTRAAEDNPNQPYAGLSSVHGCFAESPASSAPRWSYIKPKPRPITASPTSLTGSAPGTGHGQRSRSKRSAPVNSPTVGGSSTPSTADH